MPPVPYKLAETLSWELSLWVVDRAPRVGNPKIRWSPSTLMKSAPIDSNYLWLVVLTFFDTSGSQLTEGPNTASLELDWVVYLLRALMRRATRYPSWDRCGTRRSLPDSSDPTKSRSWEIRRVHYSPNDQDWNLSLGYKVPWPDELLQNHLWIQVHPVPLLLLSCRIATW